ncbi:MAG: glycosyltransferase [Bacteroidota bacterium]|nr:glycosyltransferase [Bacteroidota bacterium]
MSLELEVNEKLDKEYNHLIEKFGRSIHFLKFRPWLPKLFNDSFQILLFGFFQALFYVIRYRIDLIHARSYLPAFISLWIKAITRTKIIFDVRGLVIEECIAQGLWKADSLRTHFMKFFEKQCILKADHIVAVSHKLRDFILQKPYLIERNIAVTVIPNCVDLTIYTRNKVFRSEFRNKHNLENRNILLYSGSLASWQQTDQIVLFFSEYQKIDTASFLLILTYSDTRILKELFNELRIKDSNYLILSLNPDEIPKYSSVGDMGILFRMNGLISEVSAPLKFAEYLSLGMPVLMTDKVGDVSALAENLGVGFCVQFSSLDNLRNQCFRIYKIFTQTSKEIQPKCRSVAETYFSLNIALEKYRQVYDIVLASQNTKQNNFN